MNQQPVSVLINAVLMEDIRMELTPEQFQELKDIITAENLRITHENLRKPEAEQEELVPQLTKDGPKQNDERWFPLFYPWFEENKHRLKYTREPGGTGYNVIEATYAVTGDDSKLDMKILPMTEKIAIGMVIVDTESGDAFKAAKRYPGDIDYSNLDPNVGFGKVLVSLDAYPLIKSVTNDPNVDKGALALLKFVKKYNKEAPIIALLNGSDKPLHPEIFLYADIWFATREELQRPEYDGIREKFFEKENSLLFVMNGDDAEEGFDVLTRDCVVHIDPHNVDAKNKAGARDGAAAAVIACSVGLTEWLFARDRLRTIGELASIVAGNIMGSSATTAARSSHESIREESCGVTADEMRQNILNFKSGLSSSSAHNIG